MRRAVHPLAGLAVVGLVTQIAAATFVVASFDTPNASTEIARSLVVTGEYAAPTWRFERGSAASPDGVPARAYHLPGEPLYLAAGFATLPPAAHRLLHVPVVLLFGLSVASVGLAIGGARLAWLSGALAFGDPFTLAHGAVWDDTFLAASLNWALFAIVVTGVARSTADGTRRRALRLTLAGTAAALSAVTRLQSQIVLLSFAALAWTSRRGHAWRTDATCIAVCVVAAVGVWGTRNLVALDRFAIGTSHDGKTLFESTFRTARDTILRAGVAQAYPADALPDELRGAERATEFEADARFRAVAVRHILDNPMDVAATAGVKIAASLSGIDLGRPMRSPRNVGALIVNLTLLIFAAHGVRLWRRMPALSERRLVVQLALVSGATTILILAVGPVGMRYRVESWGFVYLAAATSLIRSWPKAIHR